MNDELKTTIESLKRENPAVQQTHRVLLNHSLSVEEADVEIARALLGCLWEQRRGLPNRWFAVLKGLRDGRSAAELFPDSLYESDDNKGH